MHSRVTACLDAVASNRDTVNRVQVDAASLQQLSGVFMPACWGSAWSGAIVCLRCGLECEQLARGPLGHGQDDRVFGEFDCGCVVGSGEEDGGSWSEWQSL